MAKTSGGTRRVGPRSGSGSTQQYSDKQVRSILNRVYITNKEGVSSLSDQQRAGLIMQSNADIRKLNDDLRINTMDGSTGNLMIGSMSQTFQRNSFSRALDDKAIIRLDNKDEMFSVSYNQYDFKTKTLDNLKAQCKHIVAKRNDKSYRNDAMDEKMERPLGDKRANKEFRKYVSLFSKIYK